jgi:hypothetical protein
MLRGHRGAVLDESSVVIELAQDGREVEQPESKRPIHPVRMADASICSGRRRLTQRGVGQTATVVSFLLSVTFACGVVIAVAHVVNRRFIAPVYDVAANLVAFGSAVAASVLLGHPLPAVLSSVAIVCWLVLARRTVLDRRERRTARSLL